MRVQEKKNLVKSGIFVFCMLIVFMIFTFTIGNESAWFAKKTSLKALVPSAQGLKVGAVVEFRGIKVGTVEKVKVVSNKEVSLDFRINSEFLPFIKTDSKVTINTKGLVGDKMLEIINGEDEGESASENTVLFAAGTVTMEDVMVKGEQLAETSARVLLKLDHLLDQINGENKIEKTLKELSLASTELKKFSKQINDEKLVQKLSSMSTNVDQMMTRINSGPGTMHSLIYQDSVYNQLDKLLGGAQRSKVLNYFIKESLKKGEE